MNATKSFEALFEMMENNLERFSKRMGEKELAEYLELLYPFPMSDEEKKSLDLLKHGDIITIQGMHKNNSVGDLFFRS